MNNLNYNKVSPFGILLLCITVVGCRYQHHVDDDTSFNVNTRTAPIHEFDLYFSCKQLMQEQIATNQRLGDFIARADTKELIELIHRLSIFYVPPEEYDYQKYALSQVLKFGTWSTMPEPIGASRFFEKDWHDGHNMESVLRNLLHKKCLRFCGLELYVEREDVMEKEDGEDVVDYIIRGDAKKVADLCDYPFSLNMGDLIKPIKSSKEMIRMFPVIFDLPTRTLLRDIKHRDCGWMKYEEDNGYYYRANECFGEHIKPLIRDFRTKRLTSLNIASEPLVCRWISLYRKADCKDLERMYLHHWRR